MSLVCVVCACGWAAPSSRSLPPVGSMVVGEFVTLRLVPLIGLDRRRWRWPMGIRMGMGIGRPSRTITIYKKDAQPRIVSFRHQHQETGFSSDRLLQSRLIQPIFLCTLLISPIYHRHSGFAFARYIHPIFAALPTNNYCPSTVIDNQTFQFLLSSLFTLHSTMDGCKYCPRPPSFPPPDKAPRDQAGSS